MPDASRPRTPRAANSRRQAETLGRHRALLEAVRDDPEAAALIARRGYSPEKLAEGLALCAAAEAAYAARSTATGDQHAASTTLRAATDDARARYAELRNTLRAVYDAPDRLRLGVDDRRAPDDRDEFLTAARATLAALRTRPYATAVAEYGLDAATLDSFAASLDALATAAHAHGTAMGRAETSTGARETAFAAFQAFMTRFRRLARVALKDHPDVAARVRL